MKKRLKKKQGNKGRGAKVANTETKPSLDSSSKSSSSQQHLVSDEHTETQFVQQALLGAGQEESTEKAEHKAGEKLSGDAPEEMEANCIPEPKQQEETPIMSGSDKLGKDVKNPKNSNKEEGSTEQQIASSQEESTVDETNLTNPFGMEFDPNRDYSSEPLGARIRVIGIGGAGGNAVNNMIRSGLTGVEFIAANTDVQALNSSEAPVKLQVGTKLTRGLGAGANPTVGEAAAEESLDEIRERLDGADMVFITAGMGGGTGGGGASVVARVAKEVGALTVGVVTKPFLFEGKRRTSNADLGMETLKREVDTLITIPNQRLLSVAGRNSTLLDTFRKADDVLYQAVKGISDLILFEGLVNVDFADVKSVMSEMGMAMMGSGEGSGENRAIEAAERAISSPLLEDVSIHGARGILINVTAGEDVTLQEINEAAELIHSEAHDEANIIWGMVIDPSMSDLVRVTVIATGFGDLHAEKGAVTGRTVPGDSLSYDKKLEIPTYARKQKEASSEQVKLKKLSAIGEEEEKYEIPTFLRRQAD